MKLIREDEGGAVAGDAQDERRRTVSGFAQVADSRAFTFSMARGTEDPGSRLMSLCGAGSDAADVPAPPPSDMII